MTQSPARNARERQALYNHHPGQSFCSHCGAPTRRAIPEGDARERVMCTQCNAVHYRNPRIVIGTVPVWGDEREPKSLQVLLCKRAIEPRYGWWTLPAGFLENEEPLTVGAAREAHEEANATLDVGDLFSVIDVPAVHQVHMFYRARLVSLAFSAGEESLDVGLFKLSEIPWDEIAFPTVKTTLKRFVEDVELVAAGGRFGLHMKTLEYQKK